MLSGDAAHGDRALAHSDRPTVNKRRLGLATAALGAAAAAGAVVLRQSTSNAKARTNPDLDPVYDLPGDVAHHQIPATDGGSLHVLERGTGRPLVLIHGIALQAAVWAPQLHQLADRYRVLAMDVRGHGRSQAGADGFGRKAAARDIATILDHFDLHDAVMVGHSMGGMILMEFVGDFPNQVGKRVAGLVFMGTAAYQILPNPVLPVAQALGRHVKQRLENGRPVPQPQFGEDDFSWAFARLAFGRRPSAKAVGQVRRFLEEVPQSTTLLSGVDLLDHDARVVLAATDTPALVLVGSRDLLTPVFTTRRVARFLPHARFEVLAGAGHHLMQERPHEVAVLLDEFVAELPPVAAG
jgi:pimeloyl-ACP methyl ester carboxylesterase